MKTGLLLFNRAKVKFHKTFIIAILVLLYLIMILISACNIADKGEGPIITDLTLYPSSATQNENFGTANITIFFRVNVPANDILQIHCVTSNGDEAGGHDFYESEDGSLFWWPAISSNGLGDFNMDVWVEDKQRRKSNIFSTSYSITQDLDLSFGVNGIIVDSFGTGHSDQEAAAIAKQQDGKFIIAGLINNGKDDDILIQGYTEGGVLDNTFGNGGTIIWDSGISDKANDLEIQSDGKIVVAALSPSRGSVPKILLMRLNSDGSLDNSFGTDGLVKTEIFQYGQVGYDLSIQSDGKIILIGEAQWANDIQALVLRYNSDGSIDETFANNGIFLYNDPSDVYAMARAVAIQPDGKIVVTGKVYYSSFAKVFVFRLNTDGTIDSEFGNDGVFYYDSIFDADSGTAISVQSDSKIVIGVTRSHRASFYNALLILRLNTDGTIDNSFGDSGMVLHKRYFGYPGFYASTIAMSIDGDIILAGGEIGQALVLKVNSEGILDESFSKDGISLIYTGGCSGAILNTDGSIVTAGYCTFYRGVSDSDVFIAKLTGN